MQNIPVEVASVAHVIKKINTHTSTLLSLVPREGMDTDYNFLFIW